MNAVADTVPPNEAIKSGLLELLQAVDEEAARLAPRIRAALPRHHASALNLAHYIGLRKRDIRRMQLGLAALGLSSLGRSEGHVRKTLVQLANWLGAIEAPAVDSAGEPPLDRAQAEALLQGNARALLGPQPAGRHVYIMVTAPDAAEADAAWADAILKAGANVLRINGAHETPGEWEATVALFRARATALGREVRIFVDMPGPKLRGEIRGYQSGLLHLPRRRDCLGRTIAPTELLLVARHAGPAEVPVPQEWLAKLQPGDVITFTDAGRRRRRLLVREAVQGGVRAECNRSLYITPGLVLEWRRKGRLRARGKVGRLPRRPRDVFLSPDDEFLLNASGASPSPKLPAIACPEPEMLASVRVGDRVILDDGKIVAVAQANGADGLRCRVLRTLKAPTRLRTGKGLAFPDSQVVRSALGPQDEVALAFALEHADGVEVSFVNSPRDVALVVERLRASKRAGFGMVLKLETREAMRNLPDILFEALRYDAVGLMIARGDLAVELSFERLAEMQEELLWFGEACHLPVIWATQVLDTLAHTGVPTRAEVTDAAMAMRAECVMLNKGPHVAAAVRTLADIICKMEAHQFKKRSLYRPLALAASAKAVGGTG
ncbi:MAG: pyruvate kinase [Burkholderiales bacterium]